MHIIRNVAVLIIVYLGLPGWIAGCNFDPGGVPLPGSEPIDASIGQDADEPVAIDAAPCLIELNIISLNGVARSVVPDRTPTLEWQSLPGCISQLDIAVGTNPGGDDALAFTSLLDAQGASLDPATDTSYRIVDGVDGFALDLDSQVAEYYITLRAGGNSGTVTATSPAFQIPPVPTQLAQLSVWLDSSDTGALFNDKTCTTPVNSAGDSVLCWANAGSGKDAVVEEGAVEYTSSEKGLEFDGDYIVIDSLFSDVLDDVAVWIVHRENQETHSFDINLNHPDRTGPGRYSAHLPWAGTQHRVYWDVSSSRLQTDKDVVGADENHIYGLINSMSLGQQSIHIDGDQLEVGATSLAATASHFCYGHDALVSTYEIVVAAPAPALAELEHMEGYLACKWDLRDQLPTFHTYYSADGEDNAGCP